MEFLGSPHIEGYLACEMPCALPGNPCPPGSEVLGQIHLQMIEYVPSFLIIKLQIHIDPLPPIYAIPFFIPTKHSQYKALKEQTSLSFQPSTFSTNIYNTTLTNNNYPLQITQPQP
jgi:hypothetical protein